MFFRRNQEDDDLYTKKQSNWRKQLIKLKVQKDEIWEGGLPGDIIIPIMGPTGVGKSTFINYLLLGRPEENYHLVPVYHDLRSCTKHLQPVPIYFRGCRFVFVDTPGFDDTYEDDWNVLRRISIWLAHSYSESAQIGGIIYLQDISQPRVTTSSLKNLNIFKELCGSQGMPKVVLATTKWSNMWYTLAKKRESQLMTDYWKEMIEQRAQVMRFDSSRSSAWKIVLSACATEDITSLQIQDELVEMKKSLFNTQAGKRTEQYAGPPVK